MPDFWDVIKEQLTELRSAKTADDVMRILSLERNPYGPDWDGAAGNAFFAGGGGDDRVYESLQDAGWHMLWYEAHYHYAMRAPNGDIITYVEGDVYRGDQGQR